MTAQKCRGTPPLLALLPLLLAAVAASCLFLLCNRYDNKYTAPGPQPTEGVLTLGEEALRQYGKVFLTRDWEIYRGRLLTPQDFRETGPLPDEYTFIGQYSGFEGDDLSASPHGSATYRLRIALPPDMRFYTLELPEIYSAYRLYVNGVTVRQMGDPDPATYRPQTGNRTVSFQAAGALELVVAVSDFAYLYSGMVYPPAFGEPDAVAGYLNLRYGLRAAALGVALCVGLLALCIRGMAAGGRGAPKSRLLLLYCLLCLCFVGYTCYPVVKTLWAGGLQWYYIENFCYCAILLLVLLIQGQISGFGGKITAAFSLFCAFVCCCSLLVPFFVAHRLALMLAYSRLLELYTWAGALFLTASTLGSLFRGSLYSPLMSAGMVVFDCALVWERIFPRHEPMVTGWFREIAAAALILLISVVMAREIAQEFRRRLALEEEMANVSRITELQRSYYPILLEKEQEVRAARHDLRHHLLVLYELALEGNLQGLLDYLRDYDRAHLQPDHVPHCQHYVVNMLLRIYADTAEKRETAFTANARLPAEIGVEDVDLCVILGNLLENALEACEALPQQQRWVHVGVAHALGRLSIAVDNSYDGVLRQEDGRLLSRKGERRAGIGLASVEAVAKRYGGQTSFYPEQAAGVFHSEVLLLAREPAPEQQTVPAVVLQRGGGSK